MKNQIVYEIAALILVLGASWINYWQLRRSSRKRELEFVDKQKQINQEKETLHEELTRAVVSNKTLTHDQEQIQHQLDEVSYQLTNLRETLNQIEFDKSNLANNLENKQQEITTLTKDLDENKEKLISLEKDIKKSERLKCQLQIKQQEQVSSLQQQLGSLRREKEHTVNTLQKELEKIATLQQRIDSLTQDKKKLEEILDKGNQRIMSLEKQLQVSAKEKEAFEATLQQKIDGLTQDKKKLEEILDKGNQRIMSLEKQLQVSAKEKEAFEATLQQKIDGLTQEKKFFEETITKEREQLSNLQEKIKELETQQSSIKDSVSKPYDIISQSQLILEDTEEVKEKLTRENTQEQQKSLFEGKKVVLLGNLSQMNRDEAKSYIQQAGGTLSSSPSVKTHYIVVGETPGDKLKKAQKFGICQLSETEFIELLESAGVDVDVNSK
jgi:NAD-dependent DNA ligase